MNLILKTTVVPKSWCLGIITPIHKEGTRDDPDNYRGICIGSALMKVLSNMMNSRLTKYVHENNLINKEQIGFKADNRTSDHILTIKSLVNKYVTDEKKGKLYTCFIDFRKAFDTVWHQGLFQKLIDLDINGNFLHTLQYIYKNTKCAVKIGVRQGVRQGDPLSPILFNIFINGIFKDLKEGNCDPVTFNGIDWINALAYADDIVLTSTTKEGLQKALNITHEYCKKLHMAHRKRRDCVELENGEIEAVNFYHFPRN